MCVHEEKGMLACVVCVVCAPVKRGHGCAPAAAAHACVGRRGTGATLGRGQNRGKGAGLELGERVEGHGRTSRAPGGAAHGA